MRTTSAAIVSMVSGSVFSPITTSTSGMRCTGPKKCMPAKRPGRSRTEAISSTESEEVFVAITASGPTTPSTSFRTAFLMSMRSTTASMTRSACPTPA